MGNQVTTLGQIYPIEYFLSEYGNDIIFEANLGSTRFMKVAKVKHQDAGYCVAKVYAINDPSIPIQGHKPKLESICNKLSQEGNLNALPFSCCLINERSVILLRQYVKYNLYDRLSTRPFLAPIEKLWIAYQLLRSIQSIHKQSICHGDIKSENILVTSFLWIALADFAPFKPVYLPENNPSDFSYFFDTSRRHSCNMAPERFFELGADCTPSTENKINMQGNSEANQITPQMDLFSVGCVLAELFAEESANNSLFDLGQILMYKKQQYSPTAMIEENISDVRIQRLILNLIDLDPTKRNSAAYHIDQLQPSLFPSYFSTLYKYTEKLIPLTPDAKIFDISRELDRILEEVITEDEHGLLLILTLVTSCLRSLTTIEAKLTSIELCVRIVSSAPSIIAEYSVDRLLPYMMIMLSKKESRVQALCLKSLTGILSNIERLSPSDSNVFVDYILPILQQLPLNSSTLVKIALADCIGLLAETSSKFLDKSDVNYDLELNALQDSFSKIVVHLLTESNNNVRRAVLEESQISKLCAFFGKEKTNEIILQHTITFLNEKNDFQLRVSFFNVIGVISDHLGAHYAIVLKPLLQQGLADSEEMVVYECLKAISLMTEKNLLPKEVLYELFQEAVPFLSFPNKWIRNAAVNFVIVLSKLSYSIDFNRRILPAIKLHLKRDIHGLRHESVLLDSLQAPLPRIVIESILCVKNDNIDEIFNVITHRKMLRDKSRYRQISETGSNLIDDMNSYEATSSEQASKSEREILTNVDRISEDRLIDSELILRKIHKNKRAAMTKPISNYYKIQLPATTLSKQQVFYQNQSTNIINNPSNPQNHSQAAQNQAANSGASGSSGSSALLKSQSASNLASLNSKAGNSSGFNSSQRYKCRSILLAHLQEHKSAVTSLQLVPNSTVFVSSSKDATIKYWSYAGISKRPQVLFRSQQTLISPDAGSVNSFAICQGPDALLSLTENNNLHIYKLSQASSSSQQVLKTHNFSSDSEQEQMINMLSLSPWTYSMCSTKSNVKGYDLRLPTSTHVWDIKLDIREGLITCLDGGEFYLTCGTSSGVLSLLDLRFYIRSASISYPIDNDKKRKRIRCINSSSQSNNDVLCSVDRNNEVSSWICNANAIVKTCSSNTQHSTLSMSVESLTSLVTGGTDRAIRYWDLTNRKTPDCKEVLNAHHDSIACLKTLTEANLTFSASRDGVIKIWR